MLNRSILLYTEFAGLSTGGSEYAPGFAVDTRVVRWMRFGDKVRIEMRDARGRSIFGAIEQTVEQYVGAG